MSDYNRALLRHAEEIRAHCRKHAGCNICIFYGYRGCEFGITDGYDGGHLPMDWDFTEVDEKVIGNPHEV